MEILLLTLYGIPLIFVFVYALIQLNLVFHYQKSKKKNIVVNNDDSFLPNVTIQLPIYNELYVVERLIDNICQLDYPLDKLEIQVLDDSDDETLALVKRKVDAYKNQGVDIKQILREERKGYKAGALAYGLNSAKGEFIAIFDADFLPESDFLKQTVSHFKDEKIGVVQTKWGHINAEDSSLTRLQAFGLDAHFSVEQVGRNQGKHFINFNGTAGIWRKSCIEDAGGWSSDTLTEDLDLSYRAQLKGWEFKYLEDVIAPAELPVEMNALKAQQFRWTKGAAECVRKNLFNVLRNKDISLSTKIHAVFHLMNSTVFICIVMMSLLSVPVLNIKHQFPELKWLFYIASTFVVSLFILIGFYWVSFKNNEQKGSLFSFIARFPLFLSVSMGLALHNAVAVIEGYLGRKTPFMRTPKFNVNAENASWTNNKYLNRSISWLSFLELCFAIYFIYGIYLGISYRDYGLLPFHLMLSVGYFYVSLKSINHVWKIENKKSLAVT